MCTRYQKNDKRIKNVMLIKKKGNRINLIEPFYTFKNNDNSNIIKEKLVRNK